MQFHFGYCENVLFGFWKVRSVETLVASVFGIFFMAVLFEALKAYR
jgi:solute carrier family 31 (copper transporter), member 1